MQRRLRRACTHPANVAQFLYCNINAAAGRAWSCAGLRGQSPGIQAAVPALLTSDLADLLAVRPRMPAARHSSSIHLIVVFLLFHQIRCSPMFISIFIFDAQCSVSAQTGLSTAERAQYPSTVPSELLRLLSSFRPTDPRNIEEMDSIHARRSINYKAHCKQQSM